MEYCPPVNCSVAVPGHTLTSSSPVVMWPLPSAVNVPTRVKMLPVPPHSSVPVIENAYWPARLALENFPGGGGGGGGFDPPPPQATATRLSETSASRAQTRFAEVFIARSRSAWTARVAL